MNIPAIKSKELHRAQFDKFVEWQQ